MELVLGSDWATWRQLSLATLSLSDIAVAEWLNSLLRSRHERRAMWIEKCIFAVSMAISQCQRWWTKRCRLCNLCWKTLMMIIIALALSSKTVDLKVFRPQIDASGTSSVKTGLTRVSLLLETLWHSDWPLSFSPSAKMHPPKSCGCLHKMMWKTLYKSFLWLQVWK